VRSYREPQSLRFVDANGLRFAYRQWGEGPLVLMFHGFPDTADSWDTIGPAVAAAGFRAVAPYMRGYAPSGVPSRDTTTRDLGDDVVALIGALGEKKARLIGHDWGAEAVYAAIGLAPEKIEKLITVGVPHRGALKPSLQIAWALRHFIVLSLPGAVERYARDDYAMTDHLCQRWSPTWRFDAAELEPVKNAFASPGCLDATLGYYRAAMIRTPDFMKRPTQVPTLCVYGTDDPALTTAHFEGARPFFQGGLTLAPISGGHFCHRESPTSAIDAIIPFLR
jgi:pimeloyl-ACP methyl ester carboxylesterase